MNEIIEPAQDKPVRVLIADDTAAIRNSMCGLISRINNVEVVGQAENGAQALELIRSLRPDVVTLDIRMPELSGLLVLEAIQHEDLPPLVMVLTGLTEPAYRDKCLALGAHYFFNKTTEFEKVMEVLKDLAGNVDLALEEAMRSAAL